MMRPPLILLGSAGVLLGLVLTLALATGQPAAVVLRFTDMAALSTPPLPASAEDHAPEAPASPWLRQQGWERVWPLFVEGRSLQVTFAGPPAQRFLQVVANQAYTVWARRLTVDPQHYPLLAITWAVERFPVGAALDLLGRNDRALAVVVSFGPPVPSGGLRPNVPRGLAFVWGETDTVGRTYTCIPPRQGPAEERLQCVYPHVKYLAVRQGGAGRVQTDYINLLEVFPQQFPDYWHAHHTVPPVVGVSFEARSDRTASLTMARLYSVTFQAAQD